MNALCDLILSEVLFAKWCEAHSSQLLAGIDTEGDEHPLYNIMHNIEGIREVFRMQMKRILSA